VEKKIRTSGGIRLRFQTVSQLTKENRLYGPPHGSHKQIFCPGYLLLLRVSIAVSFMEQRTGSGGTVIGKKYPHPLILPGAADILKDLCCWHNRL
jgi:hypothetical protein